MTAVEYGTYPKEQNGRVVIEEVGQQVRPQQQIQFVAEVPLAAAPAIKLHSANRLSPARRREQRVESPWHRQDASGRPASDRCCVAANRSVRTRLPPPSGEAVPATRNARVQAGGACERWTLPANRDATTARPGSGAMPGSGVRQRSASRSERNVRQPAGARQPAPLRRTARPCHRAR